MVTRYKQDFNDMLVDEEGDYVDYEDYLKLEKNLEDKTKKIEELERRILGLRGDRSPGPW